MPPATEEEKTKWILNYTRALQQETAELIDSVPWKWWAKYQKFDEQNAKVEVVDLFHFLISLAQTLGMTADDVYQAYLKKNAVNHARQESGYAAAEDGARRLIDRFIARTRLFNRHLADRLDALGLAVAEVRDGESPEETIARCQDCLVTL